ncbi:MAG: hypothetical protein KC646_08970 [Candidatus Cloacimonetes bacterium]|nr:hypothetical protein [Candidatus Cloacimonadota bacterium]
MKFNCDYSLFHHQLQHDFGFEEFLKSLQIKSTFLANHKLKVLTKSQASLQYQKISTALEHFSKNKLQKIVEYFNQIPNIDYMDSDVSNSSLDQVQCKQLAEFCLLNIKIKQIEESFCKPTVSLNDHDILNILRDNMQDDFLAFKTSNKLSKSKTDLEKCNDRYDSELKRFESEISQKTGLKLYYPYKKEVQFSQSLYESVRQCPHLTSEVKHDLIILDYQPSSELLQIINEKDSFLDNYNLEISKIQSRINALLQPYLIKFSKYLETRKQDLLIYSLSFFCYQSHLCVPKLIDQGLQFNDARMFALAKDNIDYKPLNFESKLGASILFGANMTGKTTVLKTLYFHFCLIQLGLPLPASSVECFFPSEVLLKLKNSGSLTKGLSSFGEEIEFWTQKFEDNAVILCDELFLNTEPSAGELISKVFLDYIKTKNVFFMCSSHYTNLFDLDDIKLFYMKSLANNKSIDRHSLLKQIPFELAPLKKDDKLSLQNMKNEAIEMALCFDIPQSIKDQLKDHLKGQ